MFPSPSPFLLEQPRPCPGTGRHRNRLLHQQPAHRASLPLTKLAQIAYSTNPAVVNVSALLANESASDVVVALNGVVKAGIIAVN